MAELILRHARANECQDVPQFKKEMAQLVDQALSNNLSLGKVLNQICTFYLIVLLLQGCINMLLRYCVQILCTLEKT